MNPDEIRRRLRFAEANAQHRPAWRMEAADPGTGNHGTLHLYGVIGGYWGEIVAADVVRAIRESTVDELDVYLNSPGGDVYDGIAIRNALRQHSARVNVTVDGIAASAASFLMTAGDTVTMGAHAEVMIHDAWTIALGNADDMRTVAADLDRISDSIAGMYAEKAGGEQSSWRALMKAETWYSAEEAVAAGLADRLDTDEEQPAEQPAARFDLSMYAHAGRADAPAPTTSLTPAALATHRKEQHTMNRAQLAAALAAGDITQDQHDAAIVALDVTDRRAQADVPEEVRSGPVNQHPAASPAAEVRERGPALAEVTRRLAAAMQLEDRRAVVNVLEDIIPSADAGEAFVNRPDWEGEAWRATDDRRPWFDAFGAVQPLTALRAKAYHWDEEPTVDEYEGDKAEIPTSGASTAPGPEWVAFRIAGGWDIDRAYVDFGDEQFLSAFWEHAVRAYKLKSNELLRTRYLDKATSRPALPANTPVLNVLRSIIRAGRAVPGGKIDRIFLDTVLFEELEDVNVGTTATLPLWLKDAAIGLDIAEGDAEVGQLRIQLDTDLAARSYAGFDSRAAKVREKAPFQVRAIDVAHGGIDLALFSYGRFDDHDPRLLLKGTRAAS
jgi:ATP-dependent Clp endopeptidase proteolytic subunit ClpP